MRTYELDCHPKLGGKTVFEADYRGRLLGPELEFFVFTRREPLFEHSNSGWPEATSAYVERRPRAAIKELYSTGLAKPELSSTQFEVSAGPFETLDDMERGLQDRLDRIRGLFRGYAMPVPIAYVGKSTDLTGSVPKVTAIKSMPEESGRYALLSELFGEGFVDQATRVASDQINIGGIDEHDAFETYNLLRGYLPFCAGFSVASPFDSKGESDGIASHRMCAYAQAVGATLGTRMSVGDLMPPPLSSLVDYVKMADALPITHPNTVYYFMRPMPHRGVAAEIRVMDKQPSLVETMALYAFVKGLVGNGAGRDVTEEILKEELESAAREGIYDRALFGEILSMASDGLPAHERRFLAPLERRLVGKTVAQKMTESGRNLPDIILDLSMCAMDGRSFT